MPSLADIPQEYLDISRQDDFKGWLMSIVASNIVKKEMMFTWAKEVDGKWTRQDVVDVIGEE